MVREQVDRYREMGVSHFMLWFADFPSRRGMRLFAESFLGPSP
jgi:hypothetical protein